jgi:hypothetical protein
VDEYAAPLQQVRVVPKRDRRLSARRECVDRPRDSAPSDVEPTDASGATETTMRRDH